MDTLLIFVLLLLVIGGAALVTSTRAKSRRRAEQQAALAGVHKAAEEDVLRFGEDITSLDIDLSGRALDEPTRQDYRRALDEYDAAKAALDGMRAPEDVRNVTKALEDGRYAMSSVRARIEGRPLPVRRPPCFFNPQHGPSVEDVPWAPPGGAQRPVPVCAADAERVRAGAEPDTRRVLVGGQRRPYWEAGPAYGPYGQGYFAPYAMSGLLPAVLMGAAVGGVFSGGWDGDGSYGEGYQEGLEDAQQGDAGAGDYGDAGAADTGYNGGDGYDGLADGGNDFGGGGGDFGGGGGDFGGGGGD